MNLKLLIAFLMLPFCGKAQIESNENVPLYRIPQKEDTVKCVMLVCDIGLKEYRANTIDMTYKTYKDFDYSVKWQIGYVYHTDGFHVEYLDENKKPLSKNIIVWMSKNTEP